MGLLSSLLPIAGSVLGNVILPGIGGQIGGALGGAIAGSGAKNKASNQQIADYSGYENAAVGRYDNLLDRTRQDFDPFLQAGTGALSSLNALMTNPGMALQNDPGYQFRLGQGVQAIDRSAAAGGMLNSGGTAKALARYGQGLASDEYQNVFNRWNTIAGYGLPAAQGNATVATAGTNGINNALLQSTLGRSSAYADKGDTNASLYGGIGGAAGELVGGLFGRQPQANTTPSQFNFSNPLTSYGPVNLPQLTQQQIPNFSSYF